MKKTIAFISIIAISVCAYAQNSGGKTDDIGRISLTSIMPDQLGSITPTALKMLENKLGQIATQNGLGGSANKRFIITANVTEISKDITPTSPPMIAYTLEVTIYVGDVLTKTKFGSTSLQVKGVDVNETKAYISALKNIKPASPELQAFLDKSKNKILEYYNSQCDFIIKDAQSLAAQNKYEEAIYRLTSVPDVCKECYEKASDAVAPVYKKYIDKQGAKLLSDAKNVWQANQNVEGANKAAVLLAGIDPDAANFKEVETFTASIAKRVKELDSRDWDFKLKQWQDGVDIQKQHIEAYKTVGVAFGENQQPNSTIFAGGWLY
jgi:hypothetical protein